MTTIYEVRLNATITFAESGTRDAEIRMSMLHTAMARVADYVRDRFSITVEWELGKPEVLVKQPFHDDDEDARD